MYAKYKTAYLMFKLIFCQNVKKNIGYTCILFKQKVLLGPQIVKPTV
jgi:hypothetical protein